MRVREKIGPLNRDFPFTVAPMVGISHVAFRQLVRSYTPSQLDCTLFTEMLSTRRLPSERLDQVAELRFVPGERLVPQLLGNEERFIAPSIAKLLNANPCGFDINMGCPVKHVLRHNWGVRLMGDPQLAADVVGVTKKHSPLPVGVKLRASLEESGGLPTLLEFTKRLQDAGADWLTIHARSSVQRHSGKADWEIVAEVGRRLDIPVLANGDIQTAKEAINLSKTAGISGAMIGRAATARPWILWQIAYLLGWQVERPPLTPEEEGREYFQSVKLYIELLQEHFEDSPLWLKRLHLYIAWSSQWFLFGHAFWKATKKAKNLQEAKGIVEAYACQHQPPMRTRIDL